MPVNFLFHRPLCSRRRGRRVDFPFYFLLRGQKVKNTSPSGKKQISLRALRLCGEYKSKIATDFF
jgi:hypothetical protein